MALTREQIIDTAHRILAENGLAGLTMRRLAQQLGVQPGAIYHYVTSKQDLLVAVAQRILDRAQIAAEDPAGFALALRAALLPVRDSADVVSFAQAFRPNALASLQTLETLFEPGLGPQHARWAAQTLIHYVLGFVAQEQNQAELIRARIVTDPADLAPSEDAFQFGVAAIVRGCMHGHP